MALVSYQPMLSILICTTSERDEVIKPLLASIDRQMSDHADLVELHINFNEYFNVGKKRQMLLDNSNGKYVCFIDSDDEIAYNYISLILEACKSDADCIGINGIITTNGANERKWFISKEYGKWFERKGIYFRTPNHISPVKRELALLAGFPEISHGEDAEFSRRLLPYLKTETIIKEPIYHYKYRNDERK